MATVVARLVGVVSGAVLLAEVRTFVVAFSPGALLAARAFPALDTTSVGPSDVPGLTHATGNAGQRANSGVLVDVGAVPLAESAAFIPAFF